MATSLQRLIILVVFMDLLLITIMTYGSNVNEDYVNNQIDSRISMYTNWTTEANNRMNTQTDDENRLQLNPYFGDAKASGKSIWELLSKGIDIRNFGSCLGEDCSFSYIYFVVAGIGIFLAVIHMLLFLEIYMLIINRKST